jgi:hypothetical protein
LSEKGRGLIGGAIVDRDDFIGAAQGTQNAIELPQDGHDAFLLVINRQNR